MDKVMMIFALKNEIEATLFRIVHTRRARLQAKKVTIGRTGATDLLRTKELGIPTCDHK